ncbi:uncharacterized protein LOC143475252 [Brachyhypopomus gauderio]|uniref:uncharacterized protein LOC143475252 n=1 Tax=Brachyhypopomus gauderio TaxID=698409 RepID=UPI0040431850
MAVFVVTFCLFITVKSSDIPELQVKRVKHGDNITIKCNHNMTEDNKTFNLFWYKQKFGKLPEHIVRSFERNEMIRFDPAFNRGRFSITMDGRFGLSINEIKEDDIGTYICGQVKKNYLEFLSGTLLMLQAGKNVYSPLTNIVTKREESTTLQCSVEASTSNCIGKYSVYWFRHGSGESHPGIIYTHEDHGDQCKNRSEHRSTQSCVYELPKKILSSSDSGTYYCAVAACGKIIFGNGTAVECTENNYWIVITLATSNVIVILIMVALFGVLFKKQMQDSSNYNPSQTNQAEDSNTLNYIAVRFTQKPSSSTLPRLKDSQDVYAQIKVS